MVEPAVRSYLASRANHVAGSLRRKIPFPLDDLRGFIWFLSRERLSVEEGGYGNTSIYPSSGHLFIKQAIIKVVGVAEYSR